MMRAAAHACCVTGVRWLRAWWSSRLRCRPGDRQHPPQADLHLMAVSVGRASGLINDAQRRPHHFSVRYLRNAPAPHWNFLPSEAH